MYNLVENSGGRFNLEKRDTVKVQNCKRYKYWWQKTCPPELTLYPESPHPCPVFLAFGVIDKELVTVGIFFGGQVFYWENIFRRDGFGKVYGSDEVVVPVILTIDV